MSPTSGTMISMQISVRTMLIYLIRTTLCLYVAISLGNPALAWGPDGHSTIGILAMVQLHEDARHELTNILGSLEPNTMIKACNWPDEVRNTDQWAWSEPLHYINIPPGEPHYSQRRDCLEKQCNPEAIKRYAGELGDPLADREQRRQAFSWVCHLVGDLHQPLHAGYAQDRGGNLFKIIFAGESSNLHTFWDRTLIKEHAGDWQGLVKLLSKDPQIQASNWKPELVNGWTDKSHALVEQQLYKTGEAINAVYAQKSWALVQQQITIAAANLALIINTVLKRTPKEGS